jgi:hypothetical protein
MLVFVALLLLGFALDCFWVALLSARHTGRLQVLSDRPPSFCFRSRVGSYVINRATRALHYRVGQKKGVLRFDELAGLSYRVEEKGALLEELFMGFGLTDFFAPYRDTVQWHCIEAVATDGTRLPLFISGVYCQREFLATWYIERRDAFMLALGLLKDVPQQAREALLLLQAQTGEHRQLP